MSNVTVTPIRTEQDYQNALHRIDELSGMNPEPDSELDDELDVISTLVHGKKQIELIAFMDTRQNPT